ncbi:hypothetical protein Efla_000595 [Eimeria flavescens]
MVKARQTLFRLSDHKSLRRRPGWWCWAARLPKLIYMQLRRPFKLQHSRQSNKFVYSLGRQLLAWLLLAVAYSSCIGEASPAAPQAILAGHSLDADGKYERMEELQPRGFLAHELELAHGSEARRADPPASFAHEASKLTKSRGHRAIRSSFESNTPAALQPETDGQPSLDERSEDAAAKEHRMNDATSEAPEPPATSMLQEKVTQIVDQLLTGMLGTGLNLMQGGPGAAQAAAAPAPIYGPTPAYYQTAEGDEDVDECEATLLKAIRDSRARGLRERTQQLDGVCKVLPNHIQPSLAGCSGF